MAISIPSLSENLAATCFVHKIAVNIVKVFPRPMVSASMPPRQGVESCEMSLQSQRVSIIKRRQARNFSPWIDQTQKIAVRIMAEIQLFSIQDEPGAIYLVARTEERLLAIVQFRKRIELANLLSRVSTK